MIGLFIRTVRRLEGGYVQVEAIVNVGHQYTRVGRGVNPNVYYVVGV